LKTNRIPMMDYSIQIANAKRDNIKIWGAKIIGPDKKFKIKRSFCSYKYLSDCSCKYGYFDYYIDVNVGDIIEIGEKSKYKNKRTYYKIIENGEMVQISYKDVLMEVCR